MESKTSPKSTSPKSTSPNIITDKKLRVVDSNSTKSEIILLISGHGEDLYEGLPTEYSEKIKI